MTSVAFKSLSRIWYVSTDCIDVCVTLSFCAVRICIYVVYLSIVLALKNFLLMLRLSTVYQKKKSLVVDRLRKFD